MDDETRTYFEELRRGLGTLNAKVDALTTSVGALEDRVGALEAQVGNLDVRFGAVEVNGDTLHEAVAALERKVDLDGERTRRFFQITAEDLRQDIQAVAEGVTLNTEAIGAIRFEIDARFRSAEVVSRAAFAAVRRDLGELRAGR